MFALKGNSLLKGNYPQFLAFFGNGTVMEMWLQHAFNGGNWTICHKGYQNHKNSKVSTCKSYAAFRCAW